MPTGQSPNRVFLARRRVGVRAAIFIVVGALEIVAIILTAVFRANAFLEPSYAVMLTFLVCLSVVGIAFIGRGLFLLRTTVQVVLDEIGVRIDTHLSHQSVRWSEIDRLESDTKIISMSAESYKVIKLMDRSGRPLAAIDERISDFEAMVAELNDRASPAAGHATYDAAEDELRSVEREMMGLRANVLVTGLFAAAILAVLCYGVYEEWHIRRYASEGVRAEATIVHREMVGLTQKIEYTFVDERGRSYSRKTAMYVGGALLSADLKQTVPVEYLRSNPDWNRLVKDEVVGARLSGWSILVAAFGLLVCGTVFVVMLFGFSLKRSNGVTKLTRWGSVVRLWGKPRK